MTPTSPQAPTSAPPPDEAALQAAREELEGLGAALAGASRAVRDWVHWEWGLHSGKHGDCGGRSVGALMEGLGAALAGASRAVRNWVHWEWGLGSGKHDDCGERSWRAWVWRWREHAGR